MKPQRERRDGYESVVDKEYKTVHRCRADTPELHRHEVDVIIFAMISYINNLLLGGVAGKGCKELKEEFEYLGTLHRTLPHSALCDMASSERYADGLSLETFQERIRRETSAGDPPYKELKRPGGPLYFEGALLRRAIRIAKRCEEKEVEAARKARIDDKAHETATADLGSWRDELTVRRVQEVLDRLPGIECEIFERRFWYGQSFEEIAAGIKGKARRKKGLSEATIRRLYLKRIESWVKSGCLDELYEDIQSRWTAIESQRRRLRQRRSVRPTYANDFDRP